MRWNVQTHRRAVRLRDRFRYLSPYRARRALDPALQPIVLGPRNRSTTAVGHLEIVAQLLMLGETAAMATLWMEVEDALGFDGAEFSYKILPLRLENSTAVNTIALRTCE